MLNSREHIISRHFLRYKVKVILYERMEIGSKNVEFGFLNQCGRNNLIFGKQDSSL